MRQASARTPPHHVARTRAAERSRRAWPQGASSRQRSARTPTATRRGGPPGASGRDVKSAMGVYTKLNRNALRLVEDDGYLLTSSCSTRITDEDFFQIIRRAASGARV